MIKEKAMTISDSQFVLNARLPLTISKEGQWYVASCVALDVHSQGKNKLEAEDNLKEAISLFFTSCFDRGTLDGALKELGFASRTSDDPPLEEENNFIDVPIPFSRQPGCLV